MNFYDNLDWNTILKTYPEKNNFSAEEYHRILSPDFPDFLADYIKLPVMERLKGVGLLCGTDFTALYKNRFRYSRFDHSIGTALIIWHFTHNKIQTLAGLFHDISTPVFSHAADFRKGDALTQTASENDTEYFIRKNKDLTELLARNQIKIPEISNYHIYPVADNEIPCLSADRLEYMFPSGAVLHGNWTLEQVKNIYSHIKILKNENNVPELGFDDLQAAEIYTEKFCETGHILQLNENKLTLQLLAHITNLAIDLKIITDLDCYRYSEAEIFEKFENSTENKEFSQLVKTYRTMKEVLHTEKPLENCFCVNIKVKQRYINPLVQTESKNHAVRIRKVSKKADQIISDFLDYKDTPYGCVKIKAFP